MEGGSDRGRTNAHGDAHVVAAAAAAAENDTSIGLSLAYV